MKKIKSNALMMLLFGICAFFGMSIVKADDYFTIDNRLTVVCNPDVIKNGQKTKCYIVTQPDVTGDPTKASVHGFVTKAFVTKDLQLIGAENTTNITGTAVGFTEEQTVTGTDKITGDDIPDQVASVRCVREEHWVEEAHKAGKIKNATANDYACAMFYTKKSQSTNAYTPAAIKSASDSYRSTILNGNTEYGIIGNYIVEMPANSTDGGACGEICIIAKGVETLAGYADWNGSGSRDTVRYNVCKEIGRQSETSHPGVTTPPTGAFASYALLVAGALIAIGAIAIAKKNNRFNKI